LYIEINQPDLREFLWNIYIYTYSSSARDMKHGVLQSPILWPAINDLPLNIQGAILVLFADDSNLIKMFSS
jgi:hypothetical protein